MEKERSGFGTFIGVFVPCILMLFGVIVFLRLGWITGHAGLPMTLTIVSLGALIALLTALSMAAIATNIDLGKGGMYYILSRSLGIEAGVAIGLPLFFKQSLSVAFCTVGFAESLHDLMPTWPISTIGIVTLIVLTLFAGFSLKGTLKLQVAIFIALVVSLISLFMGSELRPADPQTFEPLAAPNLGFWAIFALFFPAMTGMESSLSLSGDLRNPSKSLPLGTIAALVTSWVVYLLIPIFLVWHVPEERLKHDTLVVQDLARIPSLIILGIWAATLSSAIGGLLGAPRTLQAIADDGVAPKFFSRVYGPTKEPLIATVATFIIAAVSIYFGSVNKIAPLLTMICLISYAVLNVSAGFETFMGNPSWRPRFHVHWAFSFLGAFLALLAMLMINSAHAVIAFGLVLFIYFMAKRRQISVSWDDITQAIWLFISRCAIYRLAYSEGSSKSWRPHFLVFTKNPAEHTHSLVKFSQAISQSKSFLTMASFLPNPIDCEQEKQKLGRHISAQLREKNIDALVQLCHAECVTLGMKQIIEYYGFGPLVPNTILFGGVHENTIDFARVIQTAYEKHCNIVILNDRKNGSPNFGDIHIWWDNNRQQNGDFMLVLAYMLQRNPLWKKARICLNGIVESELKKEAMLVAYRHLSVQRRLPLDERVIVSAKPDEEFYDLASTFSKDAGLLFIGLRPFFPDEPLESYAHYLKKVFEGADNLPPTAFVLSSDHTPFEKILK